MEKLFKKRENFFSDVWMFLRRYVPFLNLICLFLTGQLSKPVYQRIFIVSSIVIIMNFFVSPMWFCIVGAAALEFTRFVQSGKLSKKRRKYYYSGHYVAVVIATILLAAILGSVCFENVEVPYNRLMVMQTGAAAPVIVKSLIEMIPGVYVR
jgi:hypothetical protein